MLHGYFGRGGHLRGGYPHQMMYRGDVYGGGYRGEMMGNWQYAQEVERLDNQATSSLKQ